MSFKLPNGIRGIVRSNAIGLLVVLILSIPTILPLFNKGMFTMHDDTQVVRVQQMAAALADGQLPVRWVQDLGYGYGYPLYNFYAPLPYYIGGLFVLLGFSPVVATKLMFGLGIVLSGVSMFLFARAYWGFWGGIVSAILYQYAPYHAVEAYIRGAVGEYWAIGLLPLAALGMLGSLGKLGRLGLNGGMLVGALGYAGVILSHNILGMLLVLGTAPIIGTKFWQWYRSRLEKKADKKITHDFFRKMVTVSSVVLLGLGISAFFWLPAIMEMKYTQVDKIIGGTADPRNHFVFPDQLWDSPWGYAGSAPGRADGMSFKIGKLHILLGILGGLGLAGRVGRKKNPGGQVCSIALLLVVSVFMMLEISRPVWDALPFLLFIQYPWRFLVFTLFALSFFGGAIAVFPHIRQSMLAKPFLLAALSVLVIMVNAKYFKPQAYVFLEGETYTDDQYVKWRTSRISDEYLPKDFPIPSGPEEIAGETFSMHTAGDIEEITDKSFRQTARITVDRQSPLFINIAAFPGWKIFLDYRETEPEVKYGIMSISLPAGTHIIEAKFTNTPVRTTANALSLVSFLLLFGTIGKLPGRKNDKKTER